MLNCYRWVSVSNSSLSGQYRLRNYLSDISQEISNPSTMLKVAADIYMGKGSQWCGVITTKSEEVKTIQVGELR